jgi:hypothetical protein
VAYATVDELAAALGRGSSTPKTEGLLQYSLDAAAQEIDHYCGRDPATPLPTDPPDPLAHVVNLARGVEWFKANEAVFGVLGFEGIGTATVPRDGFGRYGAALIPLVQSFGLA